MTRTTLLALAVLLAAAGPAHADLVTTSVVVTPDTIGAGNVTTATYTLTNTVGAVEGLTLELFPPTGVTVATPVVASTTCLGKVDAAPGATSLSLVDGRFGAGVSCTVTVGLTSTLPGTALFEGGTSLEVTSDLVALSASLSEPTVGVGVPTTLTVVLDNSPSASNVKNLDLSVPLPSGLSVASPAHFTTDCGTAVIPPEFEVGGGDGSQNPVAVDMNGTFAFPALAAGATCSLSFDIVGSQGGVEVLELRLLQEFDDAGGTHVGIEVAQAQINKHFVDDPVAPGGAVTVEYTLTNLNRDFPSTDITFVDDLDATLTGLVATGLPLADACGAGSLLTGTDVLTLAGGALGPEESCTFSVTLAVPPGALSGTYPSTSGDVTATVDGQGVVLGSAVGYLQVANLPFVEMELLEDPVAPGDTFTLRTHITNGHVSQPATDVFWLLPIVPFVPFPASVALPVGDPCGPGSSLALVSIDTEEQGLELTGGSLDPGATCTFDVSIDLPAGIGAGTATLVTESISATVEGATVDGLSNTASHTRLAIPELHMTVLNDPASPGGTVTIEFELSAPDEAAGDLTDVAMSLDLDAAVTGLVATGLPVADVCGVGSSLDGTSVLSLSGGTLAPGEACTFTAELAVPPDAAAGSHTLTVSALTATSEGLPVSGQGGSDDLDVGGLIATLTLPEVAHAGDVITATYTFENISADEAATGVFFTHNWSAAASGVVATGLPATVCGGGTLTGTSFLTFTGGSIPAGDSCSFDVTIQLPAGIDAGIYGASTSSITATMGGGIVADPAVGTLVVGDPLGLGKAFTETSTVIGTDATLRFTLANGHPTEPAVDAAFTDDLAAWLPGATLTALVLNECGANVTGLGTDLITVDSGSVPADGTCTIEVTVSLPAALPIDNTPTNVTSELTATLGGVAFSAPAASATLQLDALIFTKSFDSTPVIGETTNVVYTLENAGSTSLNSLRFSDDLESALTGLAASGLPLVEACGAGSTVSGTGVIQLIDGVLGAGEQCTITVPVTVPASAIPGSYPSVTADVLRNGSVVAAPASANLVALQPTPTLETAFVPAELVEGAVTTWSLTLDNTANTVPATDVLVDVTLPAGAPVAAPANVSTDCTGGTLIATSGSTTLTYTGGTVEAGGTCTISVDVLAAEVGDYTVSSGTVTSTAPDAAAVSAELNVQPEPALAIDVSPDHLGTGFTSVLTITLDNSGSTLAAADAALSVSLPVEVTVADPSDATTDCPDAILTAAAGSDTIALSGGTLAAGATCTVSLTLSTDLPGSVDIATSDLTSSLGSTAAVSAPLVIEPPLLLAAGFVPDVIGERGTSTLTIVLDNTAAGLDATSVSLSLALPTDLILAPAPEPAPATDCSGGTFTVDVDGDAVDYVEGTVPAGATCAITLVVTTNVEGTYDVPTSDAPGSNGVGAAVVATLEVEPPPSIALAFAPETIGAEGVSVMTLSLDNTASQLDATDVQLTTVLPAGLVVADPPNVTSTCGAGTFVGANDVVTFADGEMAAGFACELSIDVTAPAGGTYETVTGTLTASTGIGDTATATLEVEPPVLFAAAFSPAAVGATQTATLTLSFDNTVSVLDASDLAVALTLPEGLLVADPAGASTTCTAGAITAVPGTDAIAFTDGFVAADATCELVVEVTATNAGSQLVTTDPLTTSNGGAGVAEATLEVEPPPTLSAAFEPALVGSTAVTTLTVTIDNAESVVDTTDLALSVALPEGLELAALPAEATTCVGGVLTATGSSLTYTGGSVAAGASCALSIDLVAPGAGTFVVDTGELSSSHGPGAATEASVEAEPPPSLQVTFDPAMIGSGAVSTLTLTVNNSASELEATALEVSIPLPPGVLVADVPAEATTCSAGVVTAEPGSGTVSLNAAAVDAATVCTVTVDVVVADPGEYLVTTGPLASSNGQGAPAATDLEVEPAATVSAAFEPSLIGSSGVTTFTLTIDNSAAELDGTALGFIASLPEGLELADPTHASTTCQGGTLTAADGALTYSDGVVGAGQSCSVAVDVTAPGAGEFELATGAVVSSNGDGGPASASLQVEPPPTVAATFDPAIIGATGTSTWTLTIDNSVSVLPATGLAVSFALPAELELADPTGEASTCTGGTLSAAGGSLSFTDASVAAGASCEVSLEVTSDTAGTHTVVTAPVTSSNGDSGAAEASLQVEAPPSIAASFDPSVVGQGGGSTLTLTLNNDASVLDASGLTAQIALPAGLTFTSGAAPLTTCDGGILDGSSDTLVYSGGTVPAGMTCTVAASVTAPTAGSYDAAVGPVTSVNGDSGSLIAVLAVEPPPVATGAFVPPIMGATHTSTLTFNLDNTGSAIDAEGVAFDVTLPAGLTIDPGVPAASSCEGGELDATAGVLGYSGGIVPAGVLCTVTVGVTADTAGEYSVTTSPFASSNGSFLPVSASLQVEPAPLLSAATSPGLVRRGDIVRVTFTVDNTASGLDVPGLGLSMTLPPDVAFSTPVEVGTDCGGGSLVAAAGVGSLAGGSVEAGATCSAWFDLTSEVPGDYELTTTELASDFGATASTSTGFSVEAPPTLSAGFEPAVIGSTRTSLLTISIDNSAGALAYGGLNFALLIPDGLSAFDPTTDCGDGSAHTLDNVLALNDGVVAPGVVCSLAATVAGAEPGAYQVSTNAVDSQAGVLGTAGATLDVEPPPALVATLAPRRVPSGELAVLRLEVDNSASAVAAEELAVSATLPEGLVVVEESGVTSTCGDDTLTASAGSTEVVLAGGAVEAGSSCAAEVHVAPQATGDYEVEVTDLTSSNGSSPGTTLTISADAPPTLSIALDRELVGVGVPVGVVLTIDNADSGLDAAGLSLDVELPGGLVVAETPRPESTCVWASVEGDAGSGLFALTTGIAPAGGACEVSFAVTATTAGVHTVATSTLESTAGSTPGVSTGFTAEPSPTLTAALDPGAIDAGEQTIVVLTVDNTVATADAEDVEVSVSLPDGVEVAADGTTNCAAGEVVASEDGTTVAFTGGTVAAGTLCEVFVHVSVADNGTYVIATSGLVSSQGPADAVAVTLVVRPVDDDDDDGRGCHAGGGETPSPGGLLVTIACLVALHLRRRRSILQA